MPASAAPKAGTTATKTASNKVATKSAAASKTAPVGARAVAAAAPPRAPAKQYALPELNPTLVVRLFENIPEYKQYRIQNLDVLIQGMVALATAPLKGIGPGGMPVVSSPYANFLATLLQMAVEKGSRGVIRNG